MFHFLSPVKDELHFYNLVFEALDDESLSNIGLWPVIGFCSSLAYPKDFTGDLIESSSVL